MYVDVMITNNEYSDQKHGYYTLLKERAYKCLKGRWVHATTKSRNQKPLKNVLIFLFFVTYAPNGTQTKLTLPKTNKTKLNKQNKQH